MRSIAAIVIVEITEVFFLVLNIFIPVLFSEILKLRHFDELIFFTFLPSFGQIFYQQTD